MIMKTEPAASVKSMHGDGEKLKRGRVVAGFDVQNDATIGVDVGGGHYSLLRLVVGAEPPDSGTRRKPVHNRQLCGGSLLEFEEEEAQGREVLVCRSKLIFCLYIGSLEKKTQRADLDDMI